MFDAILFDNDGVLAGRARRAREMGGAGLTEGPIIGQNVA
jgi:hypothetical protein